MIDEISALGHNNTWDMVDLPANKKSIGCKWIFTSENQSKRIYGLSQGTVDCKRVCSDLYGRLL